MTTKQVNYEQTTKYDKVQYKSEKNEKLSVMKYEFEIAINVMLILNKEIKNQLTNNYEIRKL